MKKIVTERWYNLYSERSWIFFTIARVRSFSSASNG